MSRETRGMQYVITDNKKAFIKLKTLLKDHPDINIHCSTSIGSYTIDTGKINEHTHLKRAEADLKTSQLLNEDITRVVDGSHKWRDIVSILLLSGNVDQETVDHVKDLMK